MAADETETTKPPLPGIRTWIVLAIVAFQISALATPADPISIQHAYPSVLLLAWGAYFFGFRRGFQTATRTDSPRDESASSD